MEENRKTFSNRIYVFIFFAVCLVYIFICIFALTSWGNENTTFSSVSAEQYTKTRDKLDELEYGNIASLNEDLMNIVEDATDYRITEGYTFFSIKDIWAYVTYYFKTIEGECYSVSVGDGDGWLIQSYYDSNYNMKESWIYTLNFALSEETHRIEVKRVVREEISISKEEFYSTFEKIGTKKDVSELKSFCRESLGINPVSDFIYSSEDTCYYVKLSETDYLRFFVRMPDNPKYNNYRFYIDTLVIDANEYQ